MKIFRSFVVFLASSVAVCSSVLIAHGKEEKREDLLFRWVQYRSNGTALPVYSSLPPASYKGISLIRKVSGKLSGDFKEDKKALLLDTTTSLAQKEKRALLLSMAFKRDQIPSDSSESSS